MKKIYLAILIILFAATSCAEVVPPPTPISTPLPTNIPKPSPDRVQTPVIFASPTRIITPSPELEPSKPVRTEAPKIQIPPQFIFPTIETAIVFPATLPVAQIDDYRLKTWSESESLALITEINDIIPSLEWELMANAQKYLIMLEREFLFRHPDSNFSPSLERELAYREGASNISTYFHSKHYPVSTFRSLLEEALNSEHVWLNSVGAWVAPMGFRLVEKLDASNFYGDERSVTILHIEALNPGYATSSAIFVVEEIEDGNFHVSAVRERWLRYWPSSGKGNEVISIHDLNGNGRSEIISIEISWGHTLCSTRLSIYEWRGGRADGHIVNRAHLVPVQVGDYLNNDCKEVWNFEPREVDGTNTIIASPGFSGMTTEKCPYENPSWTRFSWTGRFFEWDGEAEDNSPHIPRCEGWNNVKEMLESLIFTTAPELIEVIREKGFQVWALKRGDLTGDGSEDLILVFDSDEYTARSETWAVIRDRGEVSAFLLPNSYYELESFFPILSICYPNLNGRQVNVFSLDDQYFAFQLNDLADGYHIKSFVSDKDIHWEISDESFTLSDMATQCGLSGQYFWEPLTGRFYKEYGRTSADMALALEDIENSFFDTGDFDKTIEELESFHMEMNSYNPRYFGDNEMEAKVYYLLAVALELSGREREAIEHYYQSWQIDPEGVVGWIASRKLVSNKR